MKEICWNIHLCFFVVGIIIVTTKSYSVISFEVLMAVTVKTVVLSWGFVARYQHLREHAVSAFRVAVWSEMSVSSYKTAVSKPRRP